MFSETETELLVLCECKGKVTDLDDVPSEIFSLDEKTRWTIFIVPGGARSEGDFNQKLNALLQAEGKSMDDVQALLNPQPGTPTEAIIRAVGELFDKTARPPVESGGYRRLQIFSGTVPTPAGEEQFDHWLEQAHLIVEESEGSAKDKRKRIMESLKGPVLEVIKAVRLSDPDVSPDKCLEALENAFGLAESGDDLYFAFRMQKQQPVEKLSDFLRRLERCLSKVIQQGGLPYCSRSIYHPTKR